MEYLTPELRQVASITMPGDIKKRMKSPSVKELSVSIANLGGRPAQLPTLRGNDVVFGRDRIAACLLLGQTEIMIQPVRCTDVEALLLEITENLHRRRDDVDKDRARYVTTLTKLLDERNAEEDARKLKEKEEKKTQKEEVKNGRPKTSRAAAREMIAEAEGVSAETIRSSEYRARQATVAAPSPDDDMNRARERAAAHLREAREIIQGYLPNAIHGEDMKPSVSMIDEAIALIHTFPWTAGTPSETTQAEDVAQAEEDIANEVPIDDTDLIFP